MFQKIEEIIEEIFIQNVQYFGTTNIKLTCR